MKHRTLLVSLLGQRCPACREGHLFLKGPYNLKGFDKMHRSCPNCGQGFELEPGFYYGAMYVSYALQVAILVAVLIAVQVLQPDLAIGWRVGLVIGVVVLLFPLLYRVSRSVWIHLFVPFNSQRSTDPDSR